MSENPLYYSGNQTSKSSNLKPALNAALASLEVHLDEELARYRRTRIAHRTPTQKSLGSLIVGKAQAQSAMALQADTQARQHLTGEQAAAYVRQQQANAQANIQTPPPPPPPVPDSLEVASQKQANSQPLEIPAPKQQAMPFPEVTTAAQEQTIPFPEATTAAQEQTIPSPEATAAAYQQAMPFPEATTAAHENTSPQNQSSIVKADINQNTQSEQLPAPSNDTNTKQPDDYLESSEALLRSLADEQQPTFTKQASKNDSLLSPLSIGSMLLLLVSSITFGYIVFNLDNLSSLTFGGLFQRNQQAKTIESTENVSDVQSTQAELKPISKNPNLASDALPNINSIDDIPGAKPTTAAKPPARVTTQAPTVPTTTVEQMSPPVTQDTPATTTPQPEAASTPQNIDEIEPSNGGFYNVIVDNTGNAFNEAKQVIPDAYLSEEGKYVYLGAFKSKDRVKQHLEVLKKNGINARVKEASEN